MLKQFGITKTQLILKALKIFRFSRSNVNDTWELYTDLQLYNPYTMDIISDLRSSTETLHNQLKESKNVET